MTRTLEAADYWRLRAICSEAQRCELLALQARAELATAHKKQNGRARRARARPGGADVHARRRHADDHGPRARVTEGSPCSR